MLNLLFLLFSLFSFADSADTVGIDGSGSDGRSNRIPLYITVDAPAPGADLFETGGREVLYETGRVWATIEEVGEKELRINLDEPIVLDRSKSSETVTSLGRIRSFLISTANANSNAHSAFLDSQVGEPFHTKGKTPEEIREVVSKVESGQADKLLDRMTLATLPELRTFAGMTFTMDAENLNRKGPIPVDSLNVIAYEMAPRSGGYESIVPFNLLQFGDPKGAWSPELIESYLQAKDELWRLYFEKEGFRSKTKSWWLARDRPTPSSEEGPKKGASLRLVEGNPDVTKLSEPADPVVPKRVQPAERPSRRVLRHKDAPNTVFLRLSAEERSQPPPDEVGRLVETSSNVTRFVVSCKKTFAK